MEMENIFDKNKNINLENVKHLEIIHKEHKQHKSSVLINQYKDL